MSTRDANDPLGTEEALDLLSMLLADSARSAREADTTPLRRLLGRLLSVAPEADRTRLWQEASGTRCTAPVLRSPPPHPILPA